MVIDKIFSKRIMYYAKYSNQFMYRAGPIGPGIYLCILALPQGPIIPMADAETYHHTVTIKPNR